MGLRDDKCSSCQTVRFTVLGVSGQTVYAQIDRRLCDCDEVPDEIDGTLDIVNTLDLEVEIGDSGFAAYMRDEETDDCQWEIFSLTCSG